MKRLHLILILSLCLAVSFDAQAFSLFKKKKPEKKELATAAKAPAPPAKGPKAYKDVITKKAKSSKGFFTVHKVESSYFLEIPDSLLGRDLLVVNRIAKSAADSRKGFVGYAGDQIGENVIRFEKGPNDKLFLKTISFSERSQDSTGMYFSVLNSNMQPIMSSFDVKAYNKDSVLKTQNAVVEITDFVNGDNSVLYFDERVKRSVGLANLFPDRSYIDTIKAFPMNIEIRAVKTYGQKPQNPSDVAGDPLTYMLNSSILLLPKEPMKPRYFDSRVAYFATGYTDFDKNPQGVERVSMATRWRLEPKDEDIEKYKKGELVEPKKPIVFYIDPSTPKKWVPYLKQGVDDWQKAFEYAGFKNAIYALEAPNDPSWSLEDARHSAIVYKPSDIPNASGPHVHDPRSGEILETHINWYHNVMKLLHDWYFVQTAAVDPRARKVQFDDELMGQLIRFVSSHEVGHTLGLRHNFGSSNTVPVEKLRDKAWVEANGHTPSIMDYARFNYVAQPEDNIGEAGLFPRIGIYDNWSIQWGYTWLPDFKTPQDEVPYLNKWVIEKLAQDKRYTFGTETDANDPRNQSEDLGDNAMLASAYGIKNLQRILPNVLEWTKEPNKDYANAATMYSEISGQFSRYMGHVSRYVAGIYTTPKRVEQSGPVYEHVPAQLQKDAVRFLDKQLFTTPVWLADKNLIEKAGINPVFTIGNIQKNVLGRIISKNTLDKLLQNETLNGTSAYTSTQLLDDLKKSIWSELASGKAIDIYRRNLQKNYIDACIALIAPAQSAAASSLVVLRVSSSVSATSDATAIARAHLVKLRSEIASAAGRASGISKAHLLELVAKTDEALNPQK
ncbi:MAG: hypothetical protein H6Q20_1445 [Bacteroidetes bacterium]|nr:hypothetical protein [Bacteroidota bacterium]